MQQWVGDHMPPTALLEQADKAEQMFYAQCNACSNKQGNIVRKNKALVGSWAPLKFLRSQVLPCAPACIAIPPALRKSFTSRLAPCPSSASLCCLTLCERMQPPPPPPPFSPCMLSSASTVIALLFNTKTKLGVAQYQLGGDFCRLLLM